jgi:DNA-binding transcriptional LysR family regulator
MPKVINADLSAFIAVAKARSFTRAAAQLGLSQSALSQTVRALETRVGVPLLRRSTAACRRPKRANVYCGMWGHGLKRLKSNWPR